MADKPKDGENAAPKNKAEVVDLLDEIGTLTYPKAVKYFGKEKAIDVMHKVAELGGHGLFEEAHFKSPLFGGLAMPSPDKVSAPRKEDFAHLPEADFHFQAAIEDHEAAKVSATDSRTAIGEYYSAQK